MSFVLLIHSPCLTGAKTTDEELVSTESRSCMYTGQHYKPTAHVYRPALQTNSPCIPASTTNQQPMYTGLALQTNSPCIPASTTNQQPMYTGQHYNPTSPCIPASTTNQQPMYTGQHYKPTAHVYRKHQLPEWQINSSWRSRPKYWGHFTLLVVRIPFIYLFYC